MLLNKIVKLNDKTSTIIFTFLIDCDLGPKIWLTDHLQPRRPPALALAYFRLGDVAKNTEHQKHFYSQTKR